MDYTKILPEHIEKYIGKNDLFLEIYGVDSSDQLNNSRPPLLFVHGAYTGSWMWSKYVPHFVRQGWKCYVMNMRGHYRSRVMDLTRIEFKDYLEDIKEIVDECGEPLIIIGFSMGGILCQKLAETAELAGLILIDTSISREINEIAPYEKTVEIPEGNILPAPNRDEPFSIDESPDDIAFQRKYLAAESLKAIKECACWIKGSKGISINSSLINCPALVIKAVNSNCDEKIGRTTAKHLNAEYAGFSSTTHTGLLIGQRCMEVVERVMKWLERYEGSF